MITIRHTHEDGTIIDGSNKGDGVYEIVSQRDNGGFTWRREPGIFIRGSREKDAQQWRINAALAALRAAGHTVSVEIDNLPRPTAEREADRADRADARADRLRQRAGLATARGTAREAAARRVLDGIPPGQPMLVDHHSYGADRNRRERAWRNQDRALDEYRYAGHLAGRADGAEANQEHRHHPRVTMRRIERLEADLRRWQRTLAATCPDDKPRIQREIDRLTEEINYWRGVLTEAADSGEFLPWGPEHIRKGDQVNVHGMWCTVRRVNRKSVSVPWIVGTMSSGVESEHTDTVPYDKVAGRRRDGWQLDTPNGQQWPVELADQVARWRDLLARAERAHGVYTDEAMWLRIYVPLALRSVHGLPRDATDDQLKAMQDAVRAQGVGTVRELAAAYLAEYERITPGT